MALTKKEVDDYFSKYRVEILKYIRTMFFNNKVVREDPKFFFSETYLYVLERIDSLKTEKDLKNYISTFIYNNTRWVNSNIRESLIYNRRIKMVDYEPYAFDEMIDEDDEQIINEIQVNEYKAINEMYYQSLKSLEKKAIWEIYFLEGKRTVIAFAEHIQMSRTVAAQCIKELKKDLEEYYQDYKDRKSGKEKQIETVKKPQKNVRTKKRSIRSGAGCNNLRVKGKRK